MGFQGFKPPSPKGGSGLFSRAISSALTEAPGEGFTQAVQSLVDKLTTNPEMTWEQAIDDVKYAMLVGAAMGGGMATAVHPFVKDRPAGQPSTDAKGVTLDTSNTSAPPVGSVARNRDVIDWKSVPTVEQDSPSAGITDVPFESKPATTQPTREEVIPNGEEKRLQEERRLQNLLTNGTPAGEGLTASPPGSVSTPVQGRYQTDPETGLEVDTQTGEALRDQAEPAQAPQVEKKESLPVETLRKLENRQYTNEAAARGDLKELTFNYDIKADDLGVDQLKNGKWRLYAKPALLKPSDSHEIPTSVPTSVPGMRPSIDHSLLSPNGRISDKAKEAAMERFSKEQDAYEIAKYGEVLDKTPQVRQPSEREDIERRIAELEGLAGRGMSPRKFKNEADTLRSRLESLPEEPIPTASENEAMTGQTAMSGVERPATKKTVSYDILWEKGKRTVSGEVVNGLLGIRKDDDGGRWNIDHIPTGKKVESYRTRKIAREVAETFIADKEIKAALESDSPLSRELWNKMKGIIGEIEAWGKIANKDTDSAKPDDVPFSKHQDDPSIQENLHRGAVAMDKVIAEKTDVINAMRREDLGDVSFYWGEQGNPAKKYAGGKGVSHIIAQRGEDMAHKMVEVIAKGKVTRSYGPPHGERAWISHEGHTAVLSLYVHGNRASWLLTGWKDDAPDVRGAFHEAAAPTLSEPTLARPREGAEANSNIRPSTPPRKSGVTAESIRASIANHPLKAGVEIHQSTDTIPESVKRSAEEQGYPLSNLEGFVHGGKAHVIADNVANVERARQVVIGHELAHLGQDTATVKRAVEFFRNTKDPKYRAMLEDVAREERYGYDLDTAKGYADAVREATAQYAESGETGRLWDVVKAEVKFALRKLGLNLKYTESDLRGITAAMMRNADAKIRGGTGQRAIRFMVAWHGTPHTLKGEGENPLGKFTTQKIGTGEGHQAYGWGMYFAGKREVGEWFSLKRDQLRQSSAEEGKTRFSLRSTLEDIQKTIGNVREFRNKPSKDLSLAAAYLGSPEWVEHKAIKRAVDANLKRGENKHEILYELTTDENGESITQKMVNLSKDKKAKRQYEALDTVTDWADARDWGKHTYDEIMSETEAELKGRGATPETISIWRDMRDGYDRALWKLIKPMLDLMQKIEAEAKAKGVKPVYPTFTREVITMDCAFVLSFPCGINQSISAPGFGGSAHPIQK